MPLLVHITPEKNVAAIRRSGIGIARHMQGVFATPVLPNFVVTHQWLRELKRFRVLIDGHAAHTMWGVYFRVRDDEPVLFGHFGREPMTLPAARAVGEFMAAADPLGMEIVLPRRIAAKEIHRIRRLPRNVGWRYEPKVRERFFCRCVVCNPAGSINSKRKWRAWEDGQASAES